MNGPSWVVPARQEAVARSLGGACRIDPDPIAGRVPDGYEAVRCSSHGVAWTRPAAPAGQPRFSDGGQR